MPHNNHFTESKSFSDVTDDEITQILADQLPQWKRSCDSPDSDIVVIHQEVFRRSINDARLLYAAIRYAGTTGKTVMIAPK